MYVVDTIVIDVERAKIMMENTADTDYNSELNLNNERYLRVSTVDI